MEDTPYSQIEILTASENLPERGALCHHCNIHIPQFADFLEIDRRRVFYLISQRRAIMAAAELRAATGCSLMWAEIWVSHGGKAKPSGEETPCPYCSKPLRTSLAKQCRFCRMNWHNPEFVNAWDTSNKVL